MYLHAGLLALLERFRDSELPCVRPLAYWKGESTPDRLRVVRLPRVLVKHIYLPYDVTTVKRSQHHLRILVNA